ncbi:MAG TPA: endonuclease III [Armatimonadota bacterium]|jgi:endonuclease-3|nr:endonuclease III [Armatimonadota bacterium]
MSEETLEQKKNRALKVIEILRKTYPQAMVTLDYKTPFQLLVATILAAQCTDERVNQVTPELFRRYPTPEAVAGADESELREIIRPTGFFNQKTKAIMEIAREIVAKYGGNVPDTLEELTQLRGVGRKTANLILGIVYKKPAIVVDTHVKRVSARLGFTKHKDPTKIEFDLMEVIPESNWIELNHLLVAHGRAICKAPTPLCERCPVLELCPYGRERMRLD